MVRQDILDYIQTHCSQHTEIHTQDLVKAFVQTGEIAKASLYRYLRTWQQNGILHKPKHGIYTLCTPPPLPSGELADAQAAD